MPIKVKKTNGKKRGRKSKGIIINYQETQKNNNDSETIPIIAHLPLTVDSLTEEKVDENIENENVNENYKNCFIKSNELNDDKIIINEVRNKDDVKCWWCKNYFDSPSVSLPENYFNNKFMCVGTFCSYNCALAYNNDLNDDNVWKRTSLLNLFYNKTYNEKKDIIPSPHWKTLKEFGGILSLEDFRNELVISKSDFTYLHPPLVSYQSEIERTKRNSYYRSSKNKKAEFNLSNELVLKRSKPLKTSRYSLENTMGLKIKKKKKKKRTSSDDIC